MVELTDEEKRILQASRAIDAVIAKGARDFALGVLKGMIIGLAQRTKRTEGELAAERARNDLLEARIAALEAKMSQ